MREREIFIEALQANGSAERAAVLEAACGSDGYLAGRVQQLLAEHERQESFFLDAAPPGVNSTAGQPELELPGSTIGSYKLLEQIGEGGMGLVYMAEQQQPVRRLVALKIVKPGMDSRQVIARFEAERQALAMMEHPNIAKVLDAGTTEEVRNAEFGMRNQEVPSADTPHSALRTPHFASGRPYFVMELVNGVPITKFCDERRLTLRQRLELLIPVCQAIQHAHQKGIIHRDVKPTNVLVALYDEVPVPKVIDFGVAKATEQKLTEKTMFTGFGQLIGTLEYMSPEQAQFNQLDIDTRSDIYALGVLLYELIAGSTPLVPSRLRTLPFDETLRLIREEEPETISARLAKTNTRARSAERGMRSEGIRAYIRHLFTPRSALRALRLADLDWIVMKCLEKDRNRRYESASGLEMDLRRYLADEPVVARPPSRAYALRKFVQRNRGPVLSACLVLLALVGGIIGTTWNMVRATTAQAIAVNEARQKEAALLASQVSERNAKEKLRLSLYERARAGRYSRQMGQRLDSLAALTEAARIRPDAALRDEDTAALCDEDTAALRDEAIAAMALPDVQRATGWQLSATGDSVAAYGTNYGRWARADAQGNISVRSIPDDREIQHIAAGPILGKYLHFSPDDRFLLNLGPGYSLGVWRVADGQPALGNSLLGCRAHAFSPDGRRLAVGQHEWVRSYDLATGQEVNRWRVPLPAHTLAFHPDGGKIAVGYFSSTVASVCDSESGAILADLNVGAMSNQVVAWHPDGDRLAVAGTDPRIQIWNVAAKRKVATLEGHTQYVAVLTFHPDGELLASHGWDGQLLLWHPASGRQLMRLISVSAPQFSADGRLLGVEWRGGRAHRLEVTPAREYRTLVSSAGAGRGEYSHGDISPDGRLLAVAMAEGARLWDLSSGREVAVLPAGTTYAFFDGNPQGALSSGTSDAEERGAFTSNSLPWSLVTCGSKGLLRWPVTSDEPEGKRLRLGPPQLLSPLRRVAIARSPNGRTLAAVTEEGGANDILDLETASVRLHLGSHPLGDVRALSADGRWAASSGWHSDRVRLWDARKGLMVHERVVGKRTTVFFTPDSRELIIARGDEFSFWDVETRQLIRQLPREDSQYPGFVAFSPDGRLMAMEMAPAVIHLIDAVTGRTIARLEDPHGDLSTWHGFTPDGTQLVVVTRHACAIHIWDLRAIRRRLKEMNLDWDWPEFPPADLPDTALHKQPGRQEHGSYTIDVIVGNSQPVN